MLRPLALGGAALAGAADWPRRPVLQALVTAAGLTNARGIPIRLVAPAPDGNLRYEARIYERGELEVLEARWHDLFNVLVWLACPRTKAALNQRHAAAAAHARGANRGRVQDALTVLDESGAFFVSTQPELVDDLRTFRWKNLFWARRERVLAAARVFVFGHGLFEKALDPYIGMTAHAMPLLVGADFMTAPLARQLECVDALAAQAVLDATRLDTPQSLAPLPLLGVPGWWPDNEREDFYDNTAYFRPGRQPRATRDR